MRSQRRRIDAAAAAHPLTLVSYPAMLPRWAVWVVANQRHLTLVNIVVALTAGLLLDLFAMFAIVVGMIALAAATTGAATAAVLRTEADFRRRVADDAEARTGIAFGPDDIPMKPAEFRTTTALKGGKKIEATAHFPSRTEPLVLRRTGAR